MSNQANAVSMSHCPHCKKPLLAKALRLEDLLSKQGIKYNFSSRNGQRIQYLVLHDTGNARSGADAAAHQKYFGSGNKNASAHYFVDSREIVQVIEESHASWHCGDGYGKYGITNQNSIGIELCINSDGDYEKTLEHAVLLIRELARRHQVPKGNIVRHYDASRKICPGTMATNNWQKWQEFKARI